jgi:hypothetical protein
LPRRHGSASPSTADAINENRNDHDAEDDDDDVPRSDGIHVCIVVAQRRIAGLPSSDRLQVQPTMRSSAAGR